MRRHLVGLQAAGLVAAGDGGRTWARSLAAGDPEQLGGALTEAAVLLECTGVTERRRHRHLAQRAAFTAYWTDFSARRAWAVQRGLSAPTNPSYPSPTPPDPAANLPDTTPLPTPLPHGRPPHPCTRPPGASGQSWPTSSPAKAA